MREHLNNNPMVQMAVIGVLLLAGGIFVLSSMGGGGEESSSSSTLSTTAAPAGEGPAPSPGTTGTSGVAGTTGVPSATTTGTTATGTAAPGATTTPGAATATASEAAPTVPARPMPRPVLAAWNANQTVVLLVVHDGGIDDDMVKLASTRLRGLPGVKTFVVPASRIARYSAITQGVGVNRVPALVVMRPKRLSRSIPTGSVSYGFQSGASIVQAVRNAGYKGPTVQYHP